MFHPTPFLLKTSQQRMTKLHPVGSAIAQAVSRRPLNTKAWVRPEVFQCAICGGQCGTGTGFFQMRLSPVNIFPPLFHIHSTSTLGDEKLPSSTETRTHPILRISCVRSVACKGFSVYALASTLCTLCLHTRLLIPCHDSGAIISSVEEMPLS
jgi:hypothetical protein